MRKKLVSVVLMFLVLMSTVTFADNLNGLNYSSEDGIQKGLVNKLLKMNSGFTREVLGNLSVYELQLIKERSGKLISCSKNYDLFLTTQNTREIASMSLSEPILSGSKIDNGTSTCILRISSEDYERYFKNKSSVEITNMIRTQNVLSELKLVGDTKFIGSNSAMRASSASNTIASAVLETSLDAIDVSTSTLCQKLLGYNFNWVTTPNMSFFTDGLALAHTANSLNLVNLVSKGGHVSHWNNTKWTTTQINPEWSSYGISAKFNFLMSTKCKGRIWETIGNTKSAVVKNAYFSTYGQYLHQSAVMTLSISLGNGSISFNPGISSLTTKSTQISQSNILTYK